MEEDKVLEQVMEAITRVMADDENGLEKGVVFDRRSGVRIDITHYGDNEIIIDITE